MCLSPHQMTSARIEREIADMERWIQDERYAKYHKYYETRIENFQALLKERAEDGSYDDDTGRY